MSIRRLGTRSNQELRTSLTSLEDEKADTTSASRSKQLQCLAHTSLPADPIYHERQSRQLCALHALNNLFQQHKAFTKKELDTICKELSPNSTFINPHKSAFGLGCYDVNVVISALAKKGYDVIWFDRRKDPAIINLDHVFGFILNVPNSPNLPLSYIPWVSRNHWTCIRKIGTEIYYDLDSKLSKPKPIGDFETLIKLLRQKRNFAEILLVVPEKTTQDKIFLPEPQVPSSASEETLSGAIIEVKSENIDTQESQ